jgi:O-antigen ligase
MAYFTRIQHLNLKLALIQVLALVTFTLLPLWKRLPRAQPAPMFLPDLHVSYFVILLPLLWTVILWLVFGLPGFRVLLSDPLRRWWALFLLLLAVWALASPSWAFIRLREPDVTVNAALQFSFAALFAVVVSCAGPPPRAIVAALSLSLVVNALIGILQSYQQGSLGLLGLGEFSFSAAHSGVGIVQAGAWRYVRPMGLMPHSNLLAGTLMIGLLASCALMLSPRRWIRWLGTGIFTLGLWALLLTFSRGSWIGFMVGGFAVLPLLWRFLRQREIRTQLAIAGGVALALGMVFFLSYRPLLGARVGEGQENVELRSVSDRLVFTEMAGRSISERPILGVGMGNFPWRTSYYLVDTDFDLQGDNVHHVFLSAWAELGIVGLALLACALVTGVEAGLKIFRTPSTAPLSEFSEGEARPIRWLEDRAARAGLMAVVMALVISGLIDHYPWTILHFQVAWWASLAALGHQTG